MKIKIAAAIGLLIALTYSLSISESANKNRCDIMNELVGQMKDYSIKEIIPQKTLWKKTLDRAMTPKDLKTLNLLRAKGTGINSNTSKAFADLQINGTSSAENISEAEKRINTGHQIKIKELFNQLTPLAKKYKSELDHIVIESQTMSLKWSAEMTAIQKKWEEKNKDLLNNQDERKHQGTGMRTGKGLGSGNGRGLHGRNNIAHQDHSYDQPRKFRNHLDPIYLIPDNLSDPDELNKFILWDGTLPKDNLKVFDHENGVNEFEDFENGNGG